MVVTRCRASLFAASMLVSLACSKSNTPPPQPPVADAAADTTEAEPADDGDGDGDKKEEKTTFTIAAWNLGWAHDSNGTGPKRAKENQAKDDAAWEWKVKEIAKVIAKAKPDVIALMEVGGEAEVGDIVLAIGQAQGPDYETAFVESDDPHTGHQIAILSTFPIRDERRFDVHLRKLVVGDVQLPVADGAPDEVTIVAIHAPEGNSARSASARKKQLEALMRPLKDARKQRPVIVLGTFGSDVVPGDGVYDGSPVGLLAGAGTRDEADDCDTSVSVGSAMRTNTEGLAYERIYACGLTMIDAEVRLEEEIIREQADDAGSPWSSVPVDKDPHRDVSDSLLVVATIELPKPPPPPEPEAKAEGEGEAEAEAK